MKECIKCGTKFKVKKCPICYPSKQDKKDTNEEMKWFFDFLGINNTTTKGSGS
jgi:hypothetical protein